MERVEQQFEVFAITNSIGLSLGRFAIDRRLSAQLPTQRGQLLVYQFHHMKAIEDDIGLGEMD
jgi:hypothetical protein